MKLIDMIFGRKPEPPPGELQEIRARQAATARDTAAALRELNEAVVAVRNRRK